MQRGLPMESKDPTRSLVIITGGGRGIGAAVASQTAAFGHHVLINYRDDRTSAHDVANRIRLSGGEASTCQADIGTEEGVLRLYEAADALSLPLIGLVNNAGVSGGFSRLDSLPEATARRVFAVNVIGAMLCSRDAVLRMSTKHGGRGGSIVNVSSIAAKLGGAGEWIHYAASKGAVDTLTIGLAREVAAEGIRVNAVAPGLVVTGFHGQAGAPNRVEQLAGGIPLGRAGTPEEVANAIVWLMSDKANYITGATIPVGGGR
jgi:NAD(P)-dependent dehydrogenase (short-subunit alcohol dehydrogenase family)